MSWFNRNNDEKTLNAYGVINVLFHTDCNLVGEHGMVLVSNRKLGLQNAAVSFFLKDYASAPAFTPRLFIDLEAAAKSQGYVLHELITYAKLKPSTQAVQAEPSREQVEESFRRSQAGVPAYKNPLDQAATFGSVRHNEVSGDVGLTLVRRAQVIPRSEHREPFDMHSLVDGFSNASIPAYLRKAAATEAAEKPAHPALARMDAAIKALVESEPRAWPLDAKKIRLRYAHVNDEQREELMTAAMLLAAKMINKPAKLPTLLNELDRLAVQYDAIEAELDANHDAMMAQRT